MTTERSILLVEDTPSLQMVYAAVLRNAGYDVVAAGSAQEGLERFSDLLPDLVLLDLMLPDRDGLEVMADMLAVKEKTNVIVITANGSINRAVEAMRARAYDFLVKPFDEQRLLTAVRNAIGALANDEPRQHQATPVTAPKPAGFVGSSPTMRHVYGRIQSVARSMASVFISGESGTGKEICAQAVHTSSQRAKGPLITLNCAAIPKDLLESEVFGHIRGAFTGAIGDKLGAAASADGGTLFLDEVCEMDLNLQAKLLRFIQTSMIQPLGATKPRKVNVRIICATNRDPLEAVRSGRFRADLYYRLYVVPIHMPPLRERGRDVIEIAESVLQNFAAEEGKVFFGLSSEVQELFLEHPWPGNVRQLLNVMRNVVVLNSGPVVTKDMLAPEIRDASMGETMAAAPRLVDTPPTGARPEPPEQTAAHRQDQALAALSGLTLAEIERRVIEATIKRNGNSVPKAAKELGLSPSTIYRKREVWA